MADSTAVIALITLVIASALTLCLILGLRFAFAVSPSSFFITAGDWLIGILIFLACIAISGFCGIVFSDLLPYFTAAGFGFRTLIILAVGTVATSVIAAEIILIQNAFLTEQYLDENKELRNEIEFLNRRLRFTTDLLEEVKNEQPKTYEVRTAPDTIWII